jgi:hypothetical protein
MLRITIEWGGGQTLEWAGTGGGPLLSLCWRASSRPCVVTRRDPSGKTAGSSWGAFSLRLPGGLEIVARSRR